MRRYILRIQVDDYILCGCDIYYLRLRFKIRKAFEPYSQQQQQVSISK